MEEVIIHMLKTCFWATVLSGCSFIAAVSMYRLGWLGYGPMESIFDLPKVVAIISPFVVALLDVVALMVFFYQRDWSSVLRVLGLITLLIVMYFVAVLMGLPTV